MKFEPRLDSRAGIGTIPEDRKAIVENLAIALAAAPFVLVAILLFGALLVGIFSIWMFIHNLVRCFKRTDETVKNVALLLLQFFVFFVGPLVYYFVCYRGDDLLGARSARA